MPSITTWTRLEPQCRANDVAEGLVMSPAAERLVHAERVAEVVRPPEELLGAVVAMHRGKLLGAQDAQGLAQLGADFVLPAFAPRHGQQAHTQPEAAAQPHEHSVVLVVGMGGDVEHGPHHRQASQGEGQARRAAALRQRDELRLERQAAEEQQGRGRNGGAARRLEAHPAVP